MKKLIILFSIVSFCSFAQNTKVIDSPSGTVISNLGGTDIPNSSSILDIRSTTKAVLLPRMSSTSRDAIASPIAGMLLYNNTSNQFNYHDGTAWQQATFGNQWGVNGTVLHHTGQVGIGISSMINPNTFLSIRGNLGGTQYEGMYIDGSGATTKPFYGYSIGTSPKAYHYYDGSTNKWHLAVGGTNRISVVNNGLVGIGTESPGYKLEVNGDAQINTDLWVNGSFDVDFDGFINRDAIVGRNLSAAGTSALTGNVTMGNNATVEGTLTVNNGKGVVRSNDSNQLAIDEYASPANISFNLGAGGHICCISIGFTTFTAKPSIAFGEITNATNQENLVFTINSITTNSAQIAVSNVGTTSSTVTNGVLRAMIIGRK